MFEIFRFKPGDRVRVRNTYHPWDGWVGEIESIANGLYKIKLDRQDNARSATYWGIDRELELVEAALSHREEE